MAPSMKQTSGEQLPPTQNPSGHAIPLVSGVQAVRSKPGAHVRQGLLGSRSPAAYAAPSITQAFPALQTPAAHTPVGMPSGPHGTASPTYPLDSHTPVAGLHATAV